MPGSQGRTFRICLPAVFLIAGTKANTSPISTNDLGFRLRIGQEIAESARPVRNSGKARARDGRAHEPFPGSRSPRPSPCCFTACTRRSFPTSATLLYSASRRILPSFTEADRETGRNISIESVPWAPAGKDPDPYRCHIILLLFYFPVSSFRSRSKTVFMTLTRPEALSSLSMRTQGACSELVFSIISTAAAS